LRNLGTQVNNNINQKLKDMPRVELFNANLLQPDKTLSQVDAPDYLHPSEIGYRKIFNPIFERITTILNN